MCGVGWLSPNENMSDVDRPVLMRTPFRSCSPPLLLLGIHAASVQRLCGAIHLFGEITSYDQCANEVPLFLRQFGDLFHKEPVDPLRAGRGRKRSFISKVLSGGRKKIRGIQFAFQMGLGSGLHREIPEK